jgi:hypothetical protein
VRIEQRHTNKRIKKLEDSRLYRFYCGCVGFLPQTPTITNCFVVKDCRDGEFVFRFTPVLTKEPPKPLELEEAKVLLHQFGEQFAKTQKSSSDALAAANLTIEALIAQNLVMREQAAELRKQPPDHEDGAEEDRWW